jgi:3-oxoacyl-[acyl-carrier-protein] synthase II
MQLKRVVVTGIGALTPIGNNAQDFWSALAKGTSGAATITRFDIEKFRTQFACEIKDFNMLDHLDRKEARKNGPFYSVCYDCSR